MLERFGPKNLTADVEVDKTRLVPLIQLLLPAGSVINAEGL